MEAGFPLIALWDPCDVFADGRATLHFQGVPSQQKVLWEDNRETGEDMAWSGLVSLWKNKV